MAEDGGLVALPPRAAYRLWAPTYEGETAVSALDELAVRELSPSLEGLTLLDAGCGTGRRMPSASAAGPRRVVGIDLAPEMLAMADSRRGSLAAADVRSLPFPPGTFDVIWCRLVLGHLRDLAAAYREFSRVSRPGARVIVTDFHSAALSSAHTRTFRDASGLVRAVETHAYTSGDHGRAGHEAGFALDACRDWVVGPVIKRFYQEAGALDRYERQQGTPLVLGLLLTKADRSTHVL